MDAGPGSRVCAECGAPSAPRAQVCAYCGAAFPLPPAPRVAAGSTSGVRSTARVKIYCPTCETLYPEEHGSCPRCPPAPAPTQEEVAAPASCPRCARDLEETASGGATPARCPQCRGTWFRRGEIGRALDLRTQGLPKEDVAKIAAGLAAPPTTPAPDPSLACPCCRALMERRPIAPRCRVLVDVCGKHGVWFDGGELEAFAGFVRAGGLEILRQWDDFGEKKAARTRGWRQRHNLSEQSGYDGPNWRDFLGS